MSFSNHISNITKNYFHLLIISKIIPLNCEYGHQACMRSNSIATGICKLRPVWAAWGWTSQTSYGPKQCSSVMMRKKGLITQHLSWSAFTGCLWRSAEYKVMVLTFKVLYGEVLSYIQGILHPYTPHRTLRSADKLQLIEERMIRKRGDRAFSAAAPKLWNALPLPLQLNKITHCFQKALKTPSI